MATWTFVKRSGAPTGSIRISLTSGSFTIDDASNTTIVTTDSQAAGDLLSHPFLALQGTSTSGGSAPPQISTPVLANGVLSKPGPSGTITPFDGTELPGGRTAPPPPANNIWNFIKCRTTGTGGAAQNNGYARVIWNFDSTGNKANPSETFDMWWGDWLYLRPGEMSGWQGEVDFLRWDNFGLYNASQDWLGFIWFASDSKFRLQRFNQQGDLQDLVLMSSAASAPSAWEGAWHRVECHTTLHHTDGSAFNELFVDGVSQGSSTTRNLYSASTSVTFTNSSSSASSTVNSIGGVSIVPGLVIAGVTGLAAGTTVTSVTGAGPYTIGLSNPFTGTTGAQTAVFVRPLDRFRVGTVAINSATQSNPVTTFHAAPYYDRQQRGLGSTVTALGRQALFQAADLSEMDGGANTQNGGVTAALAG